MRERGNQRTTVVIDIHCLLPLHSFVSRVHMGMFAAPLGLWLSTLRKNAATIRSRIGIGQRCFHTAPEATPAHLPNAPRPHPLSPGRASLYTCIPSRRSTCYLLAPPLPPTAFLAYSFISDTGFGLIWYAALD